LVICGVAGQRARWQNGSAGAAGAVFHVGSTADADRVHLDVDTKLSSDRDGTVSITA